MFIASDKHQIIAKDRGEVPDEKLIQARLLIHHDFLLEAETLGNCLSAIFPLEYYDYLYVAGNKDTRKHNIS
jgi:hypothetical protein